MKKYASLFLLITLAALGFSQKVDANLYIYKQDLVVEERDGDWKNNGVDLYIKKKEGMNSVMLAETTKDPEGKRDSFAYRAEEYNPVNGDEIRYLNGEILQSKYSKYSLVSSTVVNHPGLGDCFHIYIPKKLVYGYPWERNGFVEIERGLFINIRTFAKKYCDYTGAYADNPFMFDYETLVKVSKKPKPAEETVKKEAANTANKDDKKKVGSEEASELAANLAPAEESVRQPQPAVEEDDEPLPPPPPPAEEAIAHVPPAPAEEEVIPEPPVEPVPEEEVKEDSSEDNSKEEEVVLDPVEEEEAKITLTDDYNEAASDSFNDIASSARGNMTYSKGPDSLSEDLYSIVESIHPKSIVDIVFAIDATGSMKDDIQSLRERWLPRFKEQLKEFDDIRIGLVFYRDYGDNWRYKQLPVKLYPFTKDINVFTDYLNEVKVRGSEGGDIPEPVYEALYASVEYFEWRDNAEKKVILIGDAQPHSKPRGTVKITKDKVLERAQDKNVSFDCVIVPDSNSGTRPW